MFRDGKSPVVIDNTNVKLWEVKRYLEIAVQNNYSVVLIEPRTPWKFDSKSLKGNYLTTCFFLSKIYAYFKTFHNSEKYT